MAWYSIATSLLITILRRLIEKILQAWLADDAAAAGTLEALLQWYDHLVIEGVRFGYFVNGKKSWLIVKTQEAKERAEKIFGDRVNITTEGQRHLGAVLGSKSFKDQYCEEMVDKWITDLKVLCEIARTQPQAAYVSFTKAFKSKFTYFQRTIPSFEQYLEPLQDVINDLFVPAILGQDTPLSDKLMACFSLPTSKGGLNIPDLQEDTPYQYSSSRLITDVHTESIMKQEDCMLPCSSTILVELEDGSMVGATPNNLRAQFTSEKVKRLRVKIDKVMKDLPEEMRELVLRHQDRGASFWLEALPLEESDFVLSKEEFKDGVRLRYNLPLPDLPSNCVCGDNFTVEHALSCNKGGFINQRHDNIRDLFVCLLNRVCPNVKQEPHLTPVTGETFSHDTAITDPGARLDIKARNFWRRGQDAFFDVCVTHVNAPSQKKQETKVTFHRHEERKKRNYMERCLYVEHATFTPLVIGTNGGMGDECEKFLKNLAELLAKEDGEEYADVMMSLRTMLSFQVLRAAVLCVRGSRRPWSQNTSKLSSDFGLSLFEAGLKG